MSEEKNKKLINSNNRCKCCLDESRLLNMWDEYTNNGEPEIYGRMLSECFSLNWQQTDADFEQICMTCVARLKDAVSFKKIILQTEQFLAELLEKAKDEVKEEKEDSETEFAAEYLSMDYEDEETNKKVLDPLPIQDDNKSFQQQIKIELEPLSEIKELKSSKRHKKYSEEDFRKCMEAVRNKTMSQVKASVTFKIPVRTIRKALLNVPVEKFNLRVLKPRSDMKKQQENIDCLLGNSNATPIRGFFGRGYMCYFCPKKYEQAQKLKEHTLAEHSGDKFERLQVLRDRNIKIDITDFKCTICKKNINTIDQMWDHLSTVHEKTIHRDLMNQLVSFKLDDEKTLKCVVCCEEYKSFKLLNDHMNMKHFKNYECDKCGRGFISRKTLRAHGYRHGTGESFACQFCPKSFTTKIRRREHEKWVHKGPDKRLKCGFCEEKFADMTQKYKHEAEFHGTEIPVYKCQACNKSFRSQKSLGVHIKAYHLLFRNYKCTECDLSFFQKTQLNMHMIKHTGAREFKCNVCLKSYGRKSTLREHMRIHEDDRRFSCTHCTMAFIQKCSWRSHMRTAHGQDVS